MKKRVVTSKVATPSDFLQVRDGKVFWKEHPIRGADPLSIERCAGDWWMDAEWVYRGPNRQVGIERNGARVLNACFVVDELFVHSAACKEMKGADPETFEVLDAGVCYENEMVPEAHWEGYGRDESRVYFCGWADDSGALAKADPATFVSLRNGYGCDARYVWCGFSRLKEADAQTWAPITRDYSRDARHVFHRSRLIEGADPRDFHAFSNTGEGRGFAWGGGRYWVEADEYFREDFLREMQESLSGQQEALARVSENFR